LIHERLNLDTDFLVGLYDQRMAMEWVQKYIGLFGGNAADVTVMGESAGASSILHHITSYGGAGDEAVPFKNAIIQSPAFEFNIDYTSAYNLTLSAVVAQIEELTAISTTSTQTDVATILGDVSLADASFTILATIMDFLGDAATDAWKTVNQGVVVVATTGRFSYGVIVDGTYVPKLPQVLLAEGSFDTSITVSILVVPRVDYSLRNIPLKLRRS
jgi:carboxylesterase type B